MKKLRRLTAWAAIAGIVLLVGFVVALQSDAVSTYVARRVARALSSAAFQVEVGEVSGTWLRDLRATDVRIYSPPGGQGAGWEVRADTLAATFNLLSLFHRTVSLGEVRGTGVLADLQQGEPDSSPDSSPGATATSDSVAAPGPRWTINVGNLRLRDGRLRVGQAVLDDPGADAWVLAGIRGTARDIRIGPGIRLKVDSLEGRLRARGQGGPWGDLRFAGAYEADRVLVDTLLLNTTESHVSGRGTFPLGIPGPGLDGLDFRFSAQPLHLADLGPFLPGKVPDSIRVRVQGSAHSTDGVMNLDVEARTHAAGSLEVKGDFSQDGSAGRSHLEARLAGLDLASWGLAASPAPVDAELDAEADSARGPWTGDWSLRTQGVDARGTGALTPQSPLAWKVGGTLAYRPGEGAPSLAALDTAGAEISFEWAGEGSSLDSLTAGGRIRVEAGSFGGGLVSGVSLQAQVARGEARVSFDGALGGGSMEGRGRVDLASLPELSGSASVGVTSARVRAVDVDSLFAHVVAGGGAVDAEATAALADSGRIGMWGRWEGGREGQRIRVDSLRFADLDVHAFLPTGDSAALPHTGLNGALSGSARTTGSGWEGEGTVQVDSSRVGTEVLREGTLEARSDSTGTRLGMALTLADGRVDGEVRIDPSSDGRRLSVPELSFAGLDVGGLLDRPGINTELRGRLEGEVRGMDRKTLVGTARLALDSSRVAGVGVGSARLDLAADSGRVNLQLRARVAKGNVSLQGEGDLAGRDPTYHAQGTIDQTDLGTGGVRSGPGGAFHARFGLEGSGMAPDSMQANAWLEVDSASWDNVTVDDGRVTLALSGGVLRLDTLAVRSELGIVSGSGRLPLSSSRGPRGEMRLDGEIRRADMLAPLLGAQVVAVGEATFSASAEGALDNVELAGEANVNALLVDEIQAQGIDVSGKLRRRKGEGFDEGTGHLAIDRLRMPSIPVQRLEVDASLEPRNEMAVRATAVLDDSRTGKLSFRVEEMPDASAVRVEELSFTADEDVWTLQAPARISLADGVEIDSLSLKAQDQEIRARGRVARSGPLDLNVDVTGFRIGTLSDLLGYPALQGQVSGSLALSGDGESPHGELSVRSSLETRDAPPSQLDLTAKYGERSMDLNFGVTTEGGGGFRVSGDLPMDLSPADSVRGLLDGEPMELTLAADSLPLAWVGLFLPDRTVRGLRGVLDGRVNLNGQPDDPALAGAMTVARLNVGFPHLGVRYDGGRMALRFEDHRVILDSLRIRTDEGTLSGSGAVTIARLDEPEYDLSLVADGFHAMRSSGVDVTTSGRIQISGTGFKPVVKGRLEILRGEVYLGDLAPSSEVEGVTLTQEDYRELARVFGYRPVTESRPGPNLFDSMTIDVDVALRRDSWIRQRANPEMAIQFSGDVSVRKSPGDSIQLVGEVDGVPERSYVQQFGRRFSLASATVVFQGAPTRAQVDLTAQYEVPSRDNPDQPEVVITLDVTGTPEDLNLELSSTPPLEASDMVSYLAVGQPASRTLGGGEGSLSQTGGALALGRLSSAVETYAREQVGLDVVEITTDGLSGVTLLAGRYVSPDLYLGIRQPISLQRSSTDATQRPQEPQFEVELQAVRWLLLNLQAGGQGDTKVFVRSRISYD